MMKSGRCALPTSAEDKPVLVDTSVAVAASLADHHHHDVMVAALRGRRIGLAGHAAYETFSVLTPLPAPARRGTGEIARLLAHNFAATRYLSAQGAVSLFDELERLEIAGGTVYDALVGAAAREHGAVMVTRDRGAMDTYRAPSVALHPRGQS